MRATLSLVTIDRKTGRRTARPMLSPMGLHCVKTIAVAVDSTPMVVYSRLRRGGVIEVNGLAYYVQSA